MLNETLTMTGTPDFPFNPHGTDARATAEALIFNAYALTREARNAGENAYYFWCAYRALKHLHPKFSVAVTVPSGRYVRVRVEKDGELLHERGVNNIELSQKIVSMIEDYKMPEMPLIGEQNVWNMGRNLHFFITNVYVDQEVNPGEARNNYNALHRLIWDTARADTEIVWRYPWRNNGAQLIINPPAPALLGGTGKQYPYDMDGFGALPRAEWGNAYQVGSDTLRELSNACGGRFRQVR